VFSDAVDFALAPLTSIAITIQFRDVPPGVTGHPGSRATSYLVPGSAAPAARLAGATLVEHWYYIAGVDVMADATAAALVTLGDSLTDGRGSTTDGNDRWPDVLSRRLRAHPATAKVAVLNQGIGGNAVARGGLGPTAIDRFQRDVLTQRGARWLILFEGVNDIGSTGGPTVADDLITAYTHLAAAAHARDLRVFGATITPFGGSFYDTPAHEVARQAVNAWIRTTRALDAVLDFDAAVRDPAVPSRLLPAHDIGDSLHLTPAGYRRLADAIDLSLFSA
jgi:lysophospholipase L1-like esterase